MKVTIAFGSIYSTSNYFVRPNTIEKRCESKAESVDEDLRTLRAITCWEAAAEGNAAVVTRRREDAPRTGTRRMKKARKAPDVRVYLEFSSLRKFEAFCRIVRGQDDTQLRAMAARLARSTRALSAAQRSDRAPRKP